MRTNSNEDDILRIINGVVIEERNEFSLSDFEKKQLHKSVMRKIKHRPVIKTKWAIAASIIIICIATMTGRPTIASTTFTAMNTAINSLIFGRDKALENAVKNNYIQPVSSSPIYNNGVEISSTNMLIDSTKLAMSFDLKFDDISKLENLQGLSLNLRIKNEKDKVLLGFMDEDLSNIKLVGGITTLVDNFEIIDKDKGTVRYNVIMNSEKAEIPKVKTLKVEVKSINYHCMHEDMTNSITGNWKFLINVDDKFRQDESIKFVEGNNRSNIKVKSVNTTATGTVIMFSTPNYAEINGLRDVKLIDDKGNIQDHAGVVHRDEDTFFITFPVTLFDDPKSLTLLIEDYEGKNVEIQLYRK